MIVDSDGIGGAVSDQLFGCTQFITNAKPFSRGKIKANFVNLKSQCYYKLAELINNRQSDPDNDGKLSMMRKKAVKKILGSSQDIADAHDAHVFEVKHTGGLRIIHYYINYLLQLLRAFQREDDRAQRVIVSKTMDEILVRTADQVDWRSAHRAKANSKVRQRCIHHCKREHCGKPKYPPIIFCNE